MNSSSIASSTADSLEKASTTTSPAHRWSSCSLVPEMVRIRGQGADPLYQQRAARAMAPLPLELDRAGKTPLAVQIYGAIREAIVTGRLVPGAKLPSWRDLAIQLGISRGTVRVAYERLMNEELAIGKGAAGTRVAQSPPRSAIAHLSSEAPPLPELFYGFGVPPLAFQMGVPSQDAFPSKL